jgi:hypothetical protein
MRSSCQLTLRLGHDDDREQNRMPEDSTVTEVSADVISAQTRRATTSDVRDYSSANDDATRFPELRMGRFEQTSIRACTGASPRRSK